MFVSLPDRNNTNYPLSLANVLKSIEPNKNDVLLYHQRIIHDFVIGDPRNRGIIVFNETGSGKTITASSIAMALRETRDILVLAAKSLQSGFRQDLHKYIKMKDPSITAMSINAMINAQFNFVSTNASNMIDQINKLGKAPEEVEYEKQMGYLAGTANLNGKLLIIDEAHNLFNSIVSHGVNAYKLYETIMAAEDIKIVFLTGSPIVNDPFELVPAYNMCAGYDLLPTDYDQFYGLFVNKKTQQIKNRQKFMNRIYGLTSYYGSWYQTGGRRVTDQIIKRDNFPDQLPTIVEKIPMSYEQYSIYKAARQIEKDVTVKFKKTVTSNEAMRKPKSDGSSYRVHSRQSCNYAYPESAKRHGKKDLSLLTKEHLTNLEAYSPKMKKILENINNIPNRTHAVYSSFVSGEGVGIFALILKAHGWVEWKPGMKSNPKEERYAIYSGSIDIEERDIIKEQFSDNENARGQIIRVLLISGAGSEGLNLYNGAAIHAMEPYWNWNRMMQVFARMIRYKGHEYFKDPKEKQVQPYLYISDYPKDFDKSKVKEPTTDVKLLLSSVNNRMINERFYGAMIESSFDCPVHIQNASIGVKKSIRCMRCSPNNVPLFHRDIDKDMLTASPCVEVKEKEVKVSEITYMGKKYYYNKDADNTINLFEFKKSLKGYVPVRPDNLAYEPIVAQLTD